MEFSKNGVFHSKAVVIIFLKDQIEIPPLPLQLCGIFILKIYANNAKNIYRNLDENFWTSKPIYI